MIKITLLYEKTGSEVEFDLSRIEFIPVIRYAPAFGTEYTLKIPLNPAEL